MRALVTGAGGFVGGALVDALLQRGDDVRTVVRSQASVSGLAARGCQVVLADLAARDQPALSAAMHGIEAVFHVAGTYRIGVSRRERHLLHEANVAATRHVLDAAIGAGVPRIVYTSTANVLGNTDGQVPDETYTRPQPPRFLSYYDETKYLAHQAAEERIAAGAPILIAMPGMIYGPGDHSQAGEQIRGAMDGTLRAVAVPELGGNLVHVDDVAAGHLLIHDHGSNGRSYLLGGERARMGDVVRRAATLAGREPPRLVVPGWLLRASATVGSVATRLSASLPDLGEMVRASAGVTYWFDDARARSELGYSPRALEAGLLTLIAGGVPPASAD